VSTRNLRLNRAWVKRSPRDNTEFDISAKALTDHPKRGVSWFVLNSLRSKIITYQIRALILEYGRSVDRKVMGSISNKRHTSLREKIVDFLTNTIKYIIIFF
jgi:hypothetical protein